MSFSNDQGVVKSTDGGATWGSKASIDNNVFVYRCALTQFGGLLYALYLDNNGNQLKCATSSDGTSWTPSLIDASVAATNSNYLAELLPLATDGSSLYTAYAGPTGALTLQQASSAGTWLSVQRSITPSGHLIDTGKFGDYMGMATDGSTILMAYGSRSNSAPFRIARSSDGGSSWEAGSLSDCGSLSAMKYSSGAYYLTYSQGSSGTYFAKSSDEGGTWTVSLLDPCSGNGDGYGDILVSGSKVFVAYKDFEWVNGSSVSTQRLAVSLDGGATWTTRTVDPAKSYGCGSLAFDGSKLYLAYRDDTASIVKIAVSPDLGSTWTYIATNLGDEELRIAADSANIYLVSGGQFRSSSDGGTSWAVSMPFSGSYVQDPTFARNGTAVYIAYYSGTMSSSSSHLMLASSGDSGSTWTTGTVDSDGGGTEPALLVSGGALMFGYRSAVGLGAKFNESTDGGKSFAW